MPTPQRNDFVEFEPLKCAICFKILEYMPISQREAHYEYHFVNDLGEDSVTEAQGSKSMLNAPNSITNISQPSKSIKSKEVNSMPPDSGVNKGKSFKKWPFNAKERDVYWHIAQSTPPPSNHTPGLVQLLHKGLLRGHNWGSIRRAVLCSENVVHISREIWDAGWGCGYRNFLMACSALMTQTQQPSYIPLLESPFPPSIRNLQTWIEAAWQNGFDLEGQKELKKLIDTSKWIGTADLWVAFISRGIPAQLVDFDFKNQNEGCELLINWVVQYFAPKKIQDSKPVNLFDSLRISPITITEKMPLILQHNGHSRTVVGFEVDKTGVTNLLLFDPAYRPTLEVRTAALSEFAKTHPNQQAPGFPALESKLSSESSSLAGASNLKRKRSDDAPSEKESIPWPRDGIQNYSKASTSKILSPLKNGLSKYSSGHDGKESDLYGMVKKFRFQPKALSKNKQYQILFFPMSAPLTEYEKQQRKEVRSIKIP